MLLLLSGSSLTYAFAGQIHALPCDRGFCSAISNSLLSEHTVGYIETGFVRMTAQLETNSCELAQSGANRCAIGQIQLDFCQS